MTQRTIPATTVGATTPVQRQAPASSVRREPWWISFGEAIASLFGSPAPSPDPAARNLPPEVLRDHDPALHRALAAREAGRGLDAGVRPLLY